MLSLCELERAARILDRDFAGARVERWLQPDGERVVVTLYRRDDETGEGGKRHLLFSVAEGVARVSELASTPKAADRPPAFTAWLRAHASRARVLGVSIRDRDRQLALRFESREGELEVLLSLFGRRSNVYALDAQGVLRAALRPLETTRPELSLGGSYESPAGGLPDAGADRFADVPDDGFLAAVESHYGERESQQDAQDRVRRLQRAIRKERKNAERRLTRVEAELAEADQAAGLQRQGDLLKSSLREVVPGASEVTVRDWETGADVVIPLDPTKSAKGNLEAIFKRYHKLLRRLTKAGGQHDAARSWHDEIVALDARVEALAARGGDPAVADELNAICARPEIAKLLERPAAPVRAEAPARESTLPQRLRGVPRNLLPRRYRSHDGLEIWVGRSDEANDHLSTRLAAREGSLLPPRRRPRQPRHPAHRGASRSAPGIGPRRLRAGGALLEAEERRPRRRPRRSDPQREEAEGREEGPRLRERRPDRAPAP